MFDGVVGCWVVQDGVLLSGAALAERLAGCMDSADVDRVPSDADAPPECEFPDVTESPARVLDRVIGLEGLVCRAQAEQAEALVTFAGHCPHTGAGDRGFAGRPDISEFVVDELSCALSLTRRAVDARLSLALRLTESLPGTLAAWKAGGLDVRRVRVIADRTMVLTPEQATTVEARILPKAAGKTTAQLQRLVDRAVIGIDPAAANARHEQARHDRHVALRPSADGMSTLRAELSAEDAVTLYATLSLIARTYPATDPRTMNQRRADTLLDLVTGRTTPPAVPARPGTTGPGTTGPGTDHPTGTRGPGAGDPAASAAPSPGRGTRPAGDSPAGPAADTQTTPNPDQPTPDQPEPDQPTPDQPEPDQPEPDRTTSRTGGNDSTSRSRESAEHPDPPSDPSPGCGCTCGGGPGISNYTGPHRDTPPAPGTPRPGKPLIHVIVTAETLLGLDDAPAELAGHGPIPSELARRIAADGTWHRLLTDPLTGQALDYGRTTYRPPATLADHIRARDRVCRFPPCQTPAHHTDLDHKQRFRHGGPTQPDNLWTLCRHHHRLKDTPTGWKVTGNPQGTITWTSPTGRHYTSHPHNYQDNNPPTWTTPTPQPPQKPPPPNQTTDEPPF